MYETVNTFSRRPVAPQLISYIVFAIETVFLYALVQPYYSSSTTRIAIITIYSCSLVALIITTFICSLIDPVDPNVPKFKNKKQGMQVQGLSYCQYCQSFVHEKSKHCRQCDRCVYEFDHHCIWINNCIGESNYRVFFAMILSTWCNLLSYGLGVLLLSLEGRWHQYQSIMIANWVFCVVILVFIFLDTNLIILHIYLFCNSLTTYEFLLKRRAEEEHEEIMKANQEKQTRMRKILQQQKIKLSKNKIHPSESHYSIPDKIFKPQEEISNQSNRSSSSTAKLPSFIRNKSLTLAVGKQQPLSPKQNASSMQMLQPKDKINK